MQVQSLEYESQRLFHGPSSFCKSAGISQLEEVLPGFPSRYAGERVWTGSEMALKEDEWTMTLSEQDRSCVVQALRHFQDLSLAPGHMSRETFPLPQELSSRLRNISHACYNGRGFSIIHGLHPEDFTDEENVLVFAGLASYVAPQRGFQDVNRELVTCHVISEDLRPGAKEQTSRPAFTNGRLAFHTDLGDILTLYTMGVSAAGGKTMIASSSQVFNELASTRPDLLEELSKNWIFSNSQNYQTDGTPLVTNADGDRLVFQYSRLPITGFRSEGANPSLPRPSAKRLEAMSLLEEIAWKHAFPLPCRPGDVAFINNLCLMHARTAFDLDPDGNPMQSKRHLVKLMLRDPELAWELPESLGWQTTRVYGPNQDDGGRTEKWHLVVGRDDSLPNGRIWAGSGSWSNG